MFCPVHGSKHTEPNVSFAMAAVKVPSPNALNKFMKIA